MKKKLPLFIALYLSIVMISASLITGTAEKIKPVKFDDWLKEEVALLITEEEEQECRNLTSDQEREKFIEDFWAKRDPTPGTERNEFKEDWTRRLEYVLRNFTKGPKKGWRSDMGKVFMFFGPPVKVRTIKPGKQLEDSGGDMMEPSATIWMKEPYQEWSYQAMPELGLENPFRVIFKKYGFVRDTDLSMPRSITPEDNLGYSLDTQTPEDIRHALEIFPRAVIFNPDPKNWPQQKYVLDQESLEGKLMHDFVLSGAEIRGIPLEWRTLFARAPKGQVALSFLVRVNAGQTEKHKFEELIFFGRLKGNDGFEQDFKQSVRPEQIPGGECITTFSFFTRPGPTILYFGAMEKDKEHYTLLKSELEIPDFSSDELSSSSLILSPEVRPEPQPAAAEGFDPYKIGGYRASPRWGNIFRNDDFLNILFHIYNAHRQNNKISIKVEYFIISDEAGFRLKPQIIKRKLKEETTIAAGTQVPLSPLKPGRYTIKIVITDIFTGKTIERENEFIVAR